MKRQLFGNCEEDSPYGNDANEESVLTNLKKSFSNCELRKKMIMILTCLPESWSVRQIMREFDASNYIVRQAK